LIFEPVRARDAIERQRGGATEPKTKPELITALTAMPAYAGQEAELKRKKVAELKDLWRGAHAVGGAEDSATAEAAESGVET
jgi:hypothetical protein